MTQLCYLTASEMLDGIRNKSFSIRELVQAHLDRIAEVNPRVNAVVTLCAEQALADADVKDRQLAAGQAQGALFGLPVLHKDTYMTKGVRTTYGSPAFQDFVPEQDSAVVARQKAAGAIMLGKTNVPEFAAGSHTVNPVFGATHNPYAAGLSAGGSSGGAAAALACGMAPLADGSDMGGSLRNPASFCNVVGLRPSLGRVPMTPTLQPFNTVSVGGPMARCVADVALYLDVLAGEDPADPMTLPYAAADSSLRKDGPVRIALSPTLGGLPFEPSVARAFQEGVATLQSMGCEIAEDEPDFTGADNSFEVFRALAFVTNYGALCAERPEVVKDTVRWNVAQGLALTGADMAEAVRAQGQMFQRMRQFLNRYDFLVAPVSQVAPFPIETEYPEQIDGVAMPHYIGWMRSSYRITITGHPAISIPCGFTPAGVPIGIQIVGRYRKERELLAFAQAFESANPAGLVRPVFA